MQRVYSLDFLNKKTFDADVVNAQGDLLCPKHSEVTPELILKLYFKEIYAEEKVQAKIQPVQETPVIEETPSEKPKAPAKRIFNPAQFDEEHAKTVTYYAEKIAKLMKLMPSEISYLRDAAYNHDIGKALLTEEEFAGKIDRELVAQLGSNYLLQEKKAARDAAEAVKRCCERYSPADFALKPGAGNAPLFNIIAIADFYTNMLEAGKSKREAVDIMVKLGGERFNIFILHKFVYKLRNEKE